MDGIGNRASSKGIFIHRFTRVSNQGMPPRKQPPATSRPVLEFRGECKLLFYCTHPEVILAGPRDTTKTWACCAKIHLYCMNTPGCQGNIMRKTNKSLAGSVLRTFAKVIDGAGVRIMGGETPSMYIYPNGSRVWTGGMDNADKVLSSERDFVYVNQTEEMDEADWEMLAGSCSGRGALVRYPQLFGDANPAGSKHWIKNRAKDGKLNLLSAKHTDNPSLYDKLGNVTPEGAKRLSVLQNLTGVRRLRLYEGIWATAEGAVYDTFNGLVGGPHVMERHRVEFKRFMLAMDEGYTNPAVILVVGEDSDGRWHVFEEFHETGVLPEIVVSKAQAFYKEWNCEFAAVDESAAGLIASLNSAGVFSKGGKGRVVDGINSIQNRLQVQGDGRARLTFDPKCINTINEMESYRWQPGKAKDTPVKEHDHAPDSLRYLEDVMAVPSGAFKGSGDIHVGNATTPTGEPSILGVPFLMPGRDF